MAQSTLKQQNNSVSWAALCMASVAMTAFYFTSGQAWLLPLLMFAIWWTPAVSARFPHQSFAPYIVRMVAFALVGFSGMGKSALGSDGLFDAKTLNTLGLLAACELTIQFWRATPRGVFFGPIILWSSLVLLVACNTPDPRYITVCVPLYLICVVWVLRDFSASAPQSTLVVRSATRRQSTLRVHHAVARWMFLSLALLVGFVSQSSVQHFRDQLLSLGLELMHNRTLPQVPGISDQPRLGPRFNVPDSPQRILRIQGELRDPHLRTASFDTYANRTWGPPLSQRQPQPLKETPAPVDDKTISEARLTRLIDLENKVLFAPLNSRAIIGEGTSIEYDAAAGGPLRSEDPAPNDYTVQESDQNYEGVPTYQGPLCAPLNEEQRRLNLQLPDEIDPKVRELAEEITADKWHPAERALAVAEYLMQNHQYSREIRGIEGDPVSHFLLNKRGAHCEYFAASAAILLRCVGVPSRYVVGYLAHESSGPNETIVRQRDAHAWTECWIDGVGWVALDATPGGGRPDALPPVPVWQRGWEKLQDSFAWLREEMTRLSREQWAMILVAILAVWGVSRWRMARRQSTLVEEEGLYFVPDVRLKLAATRFENWLQRSGVEIPEATSWSKYFDAPEAEFPNRELATQFVREYESVRWGRAHDADAVAHVMQLVDELEKQAVAERKMSC
jgi:transglutaminase-like putative cysteine protease